MKYPSRFFIDENDLGPNSTQQLPGWMFDEEASTPIPLKFGLSSETPFAKGAQA